MRNEIKKGIELIKENIRNYADYCKNNEQQTKRYFIEPFIKNVLGIEMRPDTVIFEYTSDISGKKGEKVDYVITRAAYDQDVDREKPVIMIEAKSSDKSLEKLPEQLERYFPHTESYVAILTNGIEYRFYSDSERNNIMDKTPFFVFDFNKITTSDDIDQLEKLHKSNFPDIHEIREKARISGLVMQLKNNLLKQLYANRPEDLDINFIDSVRRISSESKNARKEAYREPLFNAMKSILRDLKNSIREELRNKLDDNEESTVDSEKEKENYSTSETELTVFNIVKSILAKHTDQLEKIKYQDAAKYFTIYYSDKEYKNVPRNLTICKLHNFNVNDEKKKRELEIFNIDNFEKVKLENELKISGYENELVRSFKNIVAVSIN
ncbi:MAG TPA: type I restriction enzyme HsdR N-terminal domain-containing protein [bacterium]|nr:type I restriction enzyme HsdR N-terminal domain-containing protein [bacterium]